VLLVAREGAEEEKETAVSRPNTCSNIEVAKLLIFDRKVNRVLGFLTVCRLYIRMKINIIYKSTCL